MSFPGTLTGLQLWVEDTGRARDFYGRHLGMKWQEGHLVLADGTYWHLCPGRIPCQTHGPHGLVPALEVEDISQAKAWFRQQGHPLLFQEVVPGLARLTLSDPEGNAFDLVQSLDASTWTRGANIPEPAHVSTPPRVLGLFELSLYARETDRALSFYRDVLGLDVGLAYFAHVHLLLGEIPLVIRPTWRRCSLRKFHTPGLIVRLEADNSLEERCRTHSYEVSLVELCGETYQACFDKEHTWLYWSR